MFLPAVIASDGNAFCESMRSPVEVCFGKGNFMSIEKILSNMIPTVLADHHPAVMGNGCLPTCQPPLGQLLHID